MSVPLNDNVGLMTNHHVLYMYMYMYMELKLCLWVSLIACLNTISSYTIPVDINDVSLVHSSLLQLSHEFTSEHAHCQHIHLHVYMHTLYYNSVIEHIIEYNYNQGSAQG